MAAAEGGTSDNAFPPTTTLPTVLHFLTPPFLELASCQRVLGSWGVGDLSGVFWSLPCLRRDKEA